MCSFSDCLSNIRYALLDVGITALIKTWTEG